ncbi:MAG: 1-deoxy-D-xylulose-5-phosphate synthase [Lachnospiraceae bacterium]|nr:1-deoxy-D-xylulose-5-phosphate synthase [Lachnospiraceae bacterium]
MSYLERINKPNDIKKLSKQEVKELAREIREFLVDSVSGTGGHLASNLGCVELTIALHLVMNFPEDKLIFDVGHQSYTHKILTGRRDEFGSLRQMGGLSGFPKRAESDCDPFNTGHSSTSISAAMGYAIARDLRGGDEKVACVIGDGSLTGGMVYEAINCLGQEKTPMVIILNDNEMSIDRNVGGVSKYLTSIRVGSAYNDLKNGVEATLLATRAGEKVARTIKRSKDSIKNLFVPGSFFDELGITYIGPIDGHDIYGMVNTINSAFKLNKPIVIHVKTVKGKGFRPARKHPDYFHGVEPFDRKTGKPLKPKERKSYTDIFSRHMVTLGARYENVVAITAAMSKGTGLTRFAESFPERFFDVGIAEQHAVTFAAGLACSGLLPVVAVYSSFLQRAYDQILHDVCLQGLKVIFAVDRSGLVGADGDTHQGIFGISYLRQMPGLTVMAPKDMYELMAMLDFAADFNGPTAVLYPRGDAAKCYGESSEPIEYGKSEIMCRSAQAKEKSVAVYCVGHMIEEGMLLKNLLEGRGLGVTLINSRFVNVIDEDCLGFVAENHSVVATIEENVSAGSYSELIAEKLLEAGYTGSFVSGTIDKGIIAHATVAEQRKAAKIDADSMYERITEHISG